MQSLFSFFTANLPTPISTANLYYKSSMCISPDVDLISDCSTVTDGTKLVYRSMPCMCIIDLFPELKLLQYNTNNRQFNTGYEFKYFLSNFPFQIMTVTIH